MIRVNTQRSKKRSAVIAPFVLLMALSLALQRFVALQNIRVLTDREQSPRENSKNGVDSNLGPTFGKRHICPSALSLLHQNTSIIQSAYEAAEAFHNGGGNLKAIENLLNSNIDETLDRLKLKFYPAGRSEPISDQDSATKTIIDMQRKMDVKKRGGYDQRSLPGHFQREGEERINDLRIDVMEPANDKRWDVGLGPIATSACNSVDRIRSGKGRSYDDKFMCSYQDMNKANAAHNKMVDNSSCSMISIGSNGQWGFENTVTDSTSCVTHTFDCTVLDARKPDNDAVHFYPYCIASENKRIDEREFMTYRKMVEAAGLTEAPSLFKMDVEGFEFDVMAQMLQEALESGSMDTLPLQISVELHYATRMYDIPWKMRLLTTSEISTFMGMMYNRGGYVPVHYEAIGPGCYSCAEILFVRVFCD